MGELLNEALITRFGIHHNTGDICDRGLFQAMEFFADKATKKPFDPKINLHVMVKQEAMKRGLICYPMDETVDGESGDHELLAPPFIIEGAHIEELVEKLRNSIEVNFRSSIKGKIQCLSSNFFGECISLFNFEFVITYN